MKINIWREARATIVDNFREIVDNYNLDYNDFRKMIEWELDTQVQSCENDWGLRIKGIFYRSDIEDLFKRIIEKLKKEEKVFDNMKLSLTKNHKKMPKLLQREIQNPPKLRTAPVPAEVLYSQNNHLYYMQKFRGKWFFKNEVDEMTKKLKKKNRDRVNNHRIKKMDKFIRFAEKMSNAKYKGEIHSGEMKMKSVLFDWMMMEHIDTTIKGIINRDNMMWRLRRF